VAPALVTLSFYEGPPAQVKVSKGGKRYFS